MAKFLIATMPIPGHILPVLPAVSALIERGNQVTWYGSRFFQSKIEATGARFVPIKSTLDYGDSQYNQHFPQRARLRGLQQIKFDFKHIFVDPIAGYLQDLGEIQQSLRADVLVSDTAVAAAKIMSDQYAMPWAVLNVSVLGIASRDVPPFGLGIMPSYSALGRLRNRLLYWFAQSVVFRDVQRYYDTQADRHDWPHFPFRPSVSPYLYLQPSIPAFEFPRSDLPPQLHFVGPLLPPVGSNFVPPPWWHDIESTAKPVVLVTQGTIATDAEQLLVPTLNALADEEVVVIGTTGGKTAAESGLHVPANAHVEPFIPFTQLMPRVDLMITNGGYGGVTFALAHGVPVICSGTTEDKPEVANRVVYSGLGINLKTATPTPAQIKGAVRRILADRSYRNKAQDLKRQSAHYDAPVLAAKLLEQLAASKQPVCAALSSEMYGAGWRQLPPTAPTSSRI